MDSSLGDGDGPPAGDGEMTSSTVANTDAATADLVDIDMNQSPNSLDPKIVYDYFKAMETTTTISLITSPRAKAVDHISGGGDGDDDDNDDATAANTQVKESPAPNPLTSNTNSENKSSTIIMDKQVSSTKQQEQGQGVTMPKNRPPKVEGMYNLRNPAVKRILREAAELRNPTSDYYASPLEDNIFEWHFTIRGANDTCYQNGLYHGRIILPPEYPMKPPSIIMLTESGRFETGTKICLSISSFHPETWRPGWSIRTALIALISFMTTEEAGAIGSLTIPTDQRKKIARKSQEYVCPECGAIKAHLPYQNANPDDNAKSKTAEQLLENEIPPPPNSLQDSRPEADGGIPAIIEGIDFVPNQVFPEVQVEEEVEDIIIGDANTIANGGGGMISGYETVLAFIILGISLIAVRRGYILFCQYFSP